MAGRAEGVISSSGYYMTPSPVNAFNPDPVLKHATATVNIYHHQYFKSNFVVSPDFRQKQDALWTQRTRDQLGREWMFFCYDFQQGGETYVRFVLDLLNPGAKERLEQLKNARVTFKLIQANNQNEFRSDELLANDEIEDGNPRLTVTHNFAKERKLDSGGLLKKEEVLQKFLSPNVVLHVTIVCKIGEDHVEFNEKGSLKAVVRKEWPPNK